MTDYAQIPQGERVRDCLGHWYAIVDGGPYQYRVQPLTLISRTVRVGYGDRYDTIDYRPTGAPVRVFRSDIRRDGE